jgi:ferredoxin-type protein NapF
MAAVAALWPLAGNAQTTRWVAAVSPFVTAASLLAGCAFGVAAIVALAIATIAIFRRRWFCRWICPTGLCADVAGRLGRRVGQVANLPHARWPRIGQWIAVVTLAGACAGYPLLLWLDPLAMFSGAFTLRTPAPVAIERERAAEGQEDGVPGNDDPGRVSPVPVRVWWTAAGAPAVVLLSLLLPGVWCGRLCPLGGTQELLWAAARVWRPRACAPATTPRPDSGRRLLLRTLLCTAIGVVWATAARAARAAVPRPLRPPGAGDEPRFVGLCVRCGNCVRTCPQGILAPDPGQHGIAGLLAPVVSFQDEYCREDCVRCTEVCPSGALQSLEPAGKLSAPLGLARINEDLCLLVEGQDCYVCRNFCPYGAISIKELNDYERAPVVTPARCSGCGACELYCPVKPIKAIVVET